MNSALIELAEMVAELAKGPRQGAAALRSLAARLNAHAAALEEQINQAESEGGMGDRVRMAVVGPDGSVRQRVDTSWRVDDPSNSGQNRTGTEGVE